MLQFKEVELVKRKTNMLKFLAAILIFSVPVAMAFNTAGAANAPSGSSYIMNGGTTTYSNGVTMMGGSRYTDSDGNSIPLQEGMQGHSDENDRSNLINNDPQINQQSNY